jgi:PAS domain S-box-containing protein
MHGPTTPISPVFAMSLPNSNSPRDRKFAADAMANPALQNFELFKRKPAGSDAVAPAQAEVAAVNPVAKTTANPASLGEEPMISGLAAVTVDAAGKILAVDGGCPAMFGWKSAELVGQHLKIVVKDWPESYQSKFMPRPGRADAAVSLRVIGRRMDGREFPVTLTRLAWAANATSKMNAGPAPEYWTALFGEVGDVTNSPLRRNDGPGGPLATGRLEDSAQFKGSVSALRSANEELQKKLEAMAVDAWKKGEIVNKVEKERVELAEKLSTIDAQLEGGRAALEQEVNLRNEAEKKMRDAITAKANLEAQLQEQARATEEVEKAAAQLRQEINSAKLNADRAEAARQQEAARADGFKVALTNLQHTYDELTARGSADKHVASDAKRRVEELESMLRGTSAEVERANAELEKEKAVRSRVEAELRSQLSNAKLAAERGEAACKQEAARADGFKQALANLQRGYDELNARLTSEQVAAGDTKRRMKELERLLRESSTGSQLDVELRAQLSAAKMDNERAQGAYKQEVARANRLERELAIVRQELADMDGKLSSELQPALEWRRRAKELEEMLRESNTELERARSERGRLETELRTVQTATRRRGDTERRTRSESSPTDLLELERQLRRQVEERFNSLNTQFTELREELRRTLGSQRAPRYGEFGRGDKAA